MNVTSWTWIAHILLFILVSPMCRSWSLNKILMTGPKAAILTDNATVSMYLSTTLPGYMLFMDAIGRGAQKATEECRFQFQWERWNCDISSIPLLQQRDHFKATKETAFVQAINSAGVMYVLTRQCSAGYYNVCSCDLSKHGQKGGYDWRWGGCNDNIKIGERASKKLLDTFVIGKDNRAIMNLQNNFVGRRVVAKKVRIFCKCHGPTGSCSMKTCWQELSKFRTVGKFLKRKYRRALRMNSPNDRTQNQNDPRSRRTFQVTAGTNLLYIDDSPDYCKRNVTINVPGTLGRQCWRRGKGEKTKKASRTQRKSCRTLCSVCGHRVRKETVHVASTCNCKFKWCCNVTCESCVVKKRKYYCVS